MASEQALWDRWAKAKDAAAFEALVRDLERFAFDFARRVTGHDADAEDLAQEAFPDLVIGPASGARVFGTVSHPCGIAIGSQSARTDAAGAYEINLVAAGKADVSIFLGRAILVRPSVEVPESGELRLDIELKGVNVHGHLVAEGESKGVALWRTGGGQHA